MKTEEILKKLNKTQFEAESFEGLSWVTEQLLDNLEEVDSKETNPRRDYLGTKTFYKNKIDGKFFFVEEYGNDMGHEIYSFGEVKPVEKVTTVYETVKKK